MSQDQPSNAAQWIWSDPARPNPKNRLTYFRKTFELDAIPEDATLRFAADSNAQLWINGQIVRRKVTRYHETTITAEVVNAAPYLRTGANVVVVLHHNWGPIITFQRTGNLHAGLYLAAEWLKTDATWRWQRAPQYLEHEEQITGVIGDPRIRYPQVIDLREDPEPARHQPDFDDSAWAQAYVVTDGPWPAAPQDVETEGQREHPTAPLSVLAAGRVTPAASLTDAPTAIAGRLRESALTLDGELTTAAGTLAGGTLDAVQPFTLRGQAGEGYYVTVDFGRPVHGYPFLQLTSSAAGVIIDLGYGEIARSQYSGLRHVREDGWIQTEGVVGKGYADRLVTRAGAQTAELPDERTARWWTLHIHFAQAGELSLERVGFVKSQHRISPKGSFACGDERIEQIVKLCLIHAEITMSDVYVDTPGREDGQWTEDAVPRGLLAAQWFGDTALRRLLIRTTAQSQGEDGNLHPFPPANYPAYPALYDWSVQWVTALYEDYLWTGRTDLIERYWPTLRQYWAAVLAHLREDGLWATARVFADIRVGLHCDQERQSSGIVMPWMIERLRWSVTMAAAIGEQDQSAEWATKAQRMTEAFRRYHLKSAEGGVPVHIPDRYDPENAELERGYSQAGQTIAVSIGLLTREEAQADLDYAFADPVGTPPEGVERWNNPTYGYRVLRALSDAGRTGRAVRHLLERYAPYLPAHPRNVTPTVLQGSLGGPLPEYWVSREDRNLPEGVELYPQPADDTGSHGWGAVPLIWLHDTLLGVRIIEPGGARLRIAPEDGGLPFVAGHTVTPKGTVWVHWEPQQWRLEVNLPAGVTAEVVMPKACRDRRVRVTAAAGTVTPQQRHPAGDEPFVISGGGTYLFEVK